MFFVIFVPFGDVYYTVEVQLRTVFGDLLCVFLGCFRPTSQVLLRCWAEYLGLGEDEMNHGWSTYPP